MAAQVHLNGRGEPAKPVAVLGWGHEGRLRQPHLRGDLLHPTVRWWGGREANGRGVSGEWPIGECMNDVHRQSHDSTPDKAGAQKGLVNVGGATDFPGDPPYRSSRPWSGSACCVARASISGRCNSMSPRAGRRAKPAALVKPMSIPGYEHEPPQSLEGRKPDHHLDQPRCMSCQVRARLVLRPKWLRCRRTDASKRTSPSASVGL